MTSRYGIAAIFAAGLCTLTCAQAAELWTTEGFKNPESALFDAARQKIYVSNVDGDPTAKDGAGHISLVNPDGTIETAEWVSGLDAPKGLALSGTTLYVADIDRLVAIDVTTGTVSGSWTAEGAQFLNDTTVDGQGRVYVSDMATNSIYMFDGSAITLWLQDNGLEHPNGLKADGGRLVVGTWGADMQADFTTPVPGHLIAVDLTTKAISDVGSNAPIGNLDGLEPDGAGGWLATDWMAGTLFRIGADGNAETLLDLDAGSADIGIVTGGTTTVLIPMMNSNTLVAHSVE